MDSNRSTTSFAPGGNRAISACVLLGANLAINAIATLFLFSQIDLLNRANAGARITLTEATANDSRLQTLSSIQIIVFIITAIAVLLWIYRAYRNLPELGAKGLVYSPGWAVGGFFFPIVNLVRPFQVVREIWKASDPTDADGLSWKTSLTSPLIALWWIFYIGSNIVSRVATSGIDARSVTLGQLIAMSWTVIIVEIVNAASAVLLILIIRGIETRQREKSQHPPSVVTRPAAAATLLNSAEPQSAEAFYNRGVALYDSEDYEKAIVEFDQALQLRPDYTEAHFNRGRAYYDLRDDHRAITNFNRGLELSPNDAEAHLWRAEMYADIGDRAKALADLQQAEELGVGPDLRSDADALKAKLIA